VPSKNRGFTAAATISFYSIDYRPIGAVKVSTNDLTEALADRFDSAEHDRNRSKLMGLETAAKEANLHGGRDLLRAAFKQGVGTEVRRGRPRK
jgi:hypothetical protein